MKGFKYEGDRFVFGKGVNAIYKYVFKSPSFFGLLKMGLFGKKVKVQINLYLLSDGLKF